MAVGCISVMLGIMRGLVRRVIGVALMRLSATAVLLSWIHLYPAVQSYAARIRACDLRHLVVIPGVHTPATVIVVETTSCQKTKKKRILGLGVHLVLSWDRRSALVGRRNWETLLARGQERKCPVGLCVQRRLPVGSINARDSVMRVTAVRARSLVGSRGSFASLPFIPVHFPATHHQPVQKTKNTPARP